MSGDELTKQNSDKAIQDMENITLHGWQAGIITAVADFHCSMNFTDLIYKQFYNTFSNSETGTLFQLRNKINRRNVSTSALGDHYRPNDTFIQDVTDASIITATLHHFSMDSKDDSPKTNCPPASFGSLEEKRKWFDTQLSDIVSTYIMNDHTASYSPVSTSVPQSRSDTEVKKMIQCLFEGCIHPPLLNVSQLRKYVQEAHNFTFTDHGSTSTTMPQKCNSNARTDGGI